MYERIPIKEEVMRFKGSAGVEEVGEGKVFGGNDANTILIHKNDKMNVKVLRFQRELFLAALSFFT